jgi:hypothetical protein
MQDPLASIRDIYRRLELTLTPAVEAEMHAYLAARPQEKFGRHQYDSAPAQVIAEERRVYRRYQEFFGVPDET